MGRSRSATDGQVPKVGQRSESVAEDFCVARALDSPSCAESTGDGPDLVYDVAGSTVERVVRAERLGEVEATLNDVDDNHVSELEIEGSEECGTTNCS